jgi:hypothetical protein
MHPNHSHIHEAGQNYPSLPSIKELNPRRRVYVEIPKPARVELTPRVLT